MGRTFRGKDREKLKSLYKKSHAKGRKQIYFDNNLKRIEEHNQNQKPNQNPSEIV
jgi:hypothetical protein